MRAGSAAAARRAGCFSWLFGTQAISESKHPSARISRRQQDRGVLHKIRLIGLLPCPAIVGYRRAERSACSTSHCEVARNSSKNLCVPLLQQILRGIRDRRRPHQIVESRTVAPTRRDRIHRHRRLSAVINRERCWREAA